MALTRCAMRVAASLLLASCTVAQPTQPSAIGMVDFSAPVAQISEMAWGTNLYQGLDPAMANAPGYQQRVGTMVGRSGLLRYHREDMMMSPSDQGSAWLIWSANSTTVTWNYTHIAAAMQHAFWTSAGASAGQRVLVCFSAWPPVWQAADKTLNTTFWPAYTALLHNFVAFVNGPSSSGGLGLGITYFEVTNEMDQPYAAAGKTVELAQLVLAGAAAIRQADPGAKVGGPAWARADITANVDAFVAATANQLDFYSYHSYATGSSSTANSSIYDTAATPFLTTDVKVAVQTYYGAANASRVMLFHDENNISWDPPDARMGNSVGAVFDALFATSAITAGATAAARWNECDGWYGAINTDSNFTAKPAAYVWQLLNEKVYGSVAASAAWPAWDVMSTFASFGPSRGGTATGSGGVEVGSGKAEGMGEGNVEASITAPSSSPSAASPFDYAVVLMNRAGTDISCSLTISAWPAGANPVTPATPVTAWLVDNAGLHSSSITLGQAQAGMTCPQDTVTFLIWTA